MLLINENLISNGHLDCFFFESKSGCCSCCFIPKTKVCRIAPCTSKERTDGKTGYFKF